MSVNKNWVITIKNYSRWFVYTWIKAWNVEVYLKEKWYHIATYNIKVKEIPVVKKYDITIQDWKSTKMYLPTSGKYYKFWFKNINSGKIRVSWKKGYINIVWAHQWNVELKV